MMNRNLWEETIEVLENNGKSFCDVIAVYGDNFQITKENFEKIARKTIYNASYGAQLVADDLKIFGKNFAMIREEYDGLEWWKFISFGGNIPREFKSVSKLAGGCWSSLAKINEIEVE